MDLTNLDTIKNLLQESGTGAEKKFGQNFLINRTIVEKLVGSAEIHQKDIVLEVGPGTGVVTEELAKKAGLVFAFEIDENKMPILERVLKSHQNAIIINRDFLQVDLGKFLKDQGIENYKFVSSLPYNISKRILQTLLESENRPDLISVIIQKEVAEKYIPPKNNKTFLSNYLELFAKGEIITTFGPENFYPAPKVDSAILKISVKKDVTIDRKFVKFLKSGFLSPRKKLANVLSGIIRKDVKDLRKIFADSGIDENVRAENLSLTDWQNLFNHLKQNG